MNIHALVVSKDEIKKRKGFTGADWWKDENGDLQIRVEAMTNRRHIPLIIHEIVEAVLFFEHGKNIEDTDKFDKNIQENPDDVLGDIEAGDLPGCPYAREHTAATACERVVFMELPCGSWKEYDLELAAL